MIETVERLVERFESARNPELAGGMAAYMRGQFTFLGIRAPQRRALQNSLWRDMPPPTGGQMLDVVAELWSQTEREYQYAAADLLAKHIGRCDAASLGDIEQLIITKSWWDTVDTVCRGGAGALVRAHPELHSEMDRWLNSTNLWLIRSAILHQERWGAGMDIAWIFAACGQQAGHPDFFVRKAIGWVLRTYAHRGPVQADAVRTFIAEHADSLSGLSKREALLRVRD